MTLFQKLSNWLFGVPAIPTQKADEPPLEPPKPTPAPPPPVVAAPQCHTPPAPPAAPPSQPQTLNDVISITLTSDSAISQNTATLTVNSSSMWPFTSVTVDTTSTVAATEAKKPRKPRAKKDAPAPSAAVITTGKPRKPRKKKN